MSSVVEYPEPVVLSPEEAEALYQWLESDEGPEYWEDAVLAPLHGRLSAFRRQGGTL